MIQWILVAQRAGAQLFRSAPSGIHLTRLLEIPHPEGRLRDGQIVSDRLGRRPGGGIQPEVLPHEHETDRFALQLAKLIERARAHREYDQLVLVAEPRFLGRLRAVMSRQSLATLKRAIPKELSRMSETELKRAINRLIAA